MAIRLLFPYACIERNLVDEGVLTQDYMDMLANTMDSMRKKDPKGRQVSNQYTGWQSNDGVERNPTFSKAIRTIKNTFDTELLSYTGHSPTELQLSIGNAWANINDNTAWNAPHLHNGCWYSGVFYIKADGDEGNFMAIDTDCKVVSDFPYSPRDAQNWKLAPRTGHLFLFPSALMHMVEPNLTQKDRYSISFNMNMNFLSNKARHSQLQGFHPDELTFHTDENGKLIQNQTTTDE
jgi:uncharacterized protein (TIGR02466 family)